MMESEISYRNHGCESDFPAQQGGLASSLCYQIFFIHSGCGVLQNKYKLFALGPGQGFILKPGQYFTLKADEQAPWRFSWLALDGSLLERVMRYANLGEVNSVFYFFPGSWLHMCIQDFNRTFSDLFQHELFRQSLLYRLSAELTIAANFETLGGPFYDRKDYYVHQMLDYIHLHYDSKLTISQIARFLNIDRVYLSTLVKEKLQTSPQQYLLNYRLVKAMELLQDKSLTVTDIAKAVGYDDPLLFSKMFKKKTGLSPSIYRALPSE